MNKEYFLSINDVAKQLDLPAHTLRYWEKQFPAAIKPTTGAGGRRYYRAETVITLTRIRDLLYTHGMTIAGVKKMLKDGELPDTAEFGSGTRVPKIGAKSQPKKAEIAAEKNEDIESESESEFIYTEKTTEIFLENAQSKSESQIVSAVLKADRGGLFSAKSDVQTVIDLLERARAELK